MSESNSGGGFVLHTAVTAFIAVIPKEVWSYGEKLVSVLVLAVVAEIGRQVVIRFWRKS